MGAAGWVAVILAMMAMVLLGGWKLAHARSAVGLLEWADRVAGGTGGTALVTSGEPYGAHQAQRLDVIAPNPPGPHPVLVFFHGGGWDSGQPEDYRFVGRAFAREGHVVVLAGYRLGPDGLYPAMMDDAADALAWVRGNIAALGGDPQRVFVMGHSAGAHLAALVTLDRRWLAARGLPSGFVRGVIGLSGPYDFHPFTSDQARRAFGHVADPAQTQPIAFVRADAPPMLLLTGDADVTVKPRNSTALGSALASAGAAAQVMRLAGVDHAGTIKALAWPFSGDGRVKRAMLDFLASQGAASAPVQAAQP
ncbi:MAG TPA: alpha/beta hydrolase [Novosphingobium sp.]|nr:alpha/beta hydrolase [Novosphingobium sp.]HMP55296.1 alpha/beta hydrolase [Novosphingobium sp.]